MDKVVSCPTLVIGKDCVCKSQILSKFKNVYNLCALLFLPPYQASTSLIIFYLLLFGSLFHIRCHHLSNLLNDLHLCLSVQSASQVHGGQFTAGFVDGSVKLYDVRTPEM